MLSTCDIRARGSRPAASTRGATPASSIDPSRLRLTALAAMLSMLLLLFTAIGGATADARTSASKRADVRRILAPVASLDRAVDRRRSELDQLGREWSAGVAPCLQEAYAELRRQAEAGRLTGAEASTYGWILFGVAAIDAAVELSQPLDGELAEAQRAYRRMPVRDRVLRAGARGKARELAAVRGLEDVDTCRFAREWAAAGFSLLEVPELAPGLTLADDLGGPAATRAVERATKRLRRLGVSKRRAEVFRAFPLLTLAEPALDDALFPTL